MDPNTLGDYWLSLWRHVAAPETVWGIIGAAVGYFGKAYLDQRRAKKRQREDKATSELEELHALTAAAVVAFRLGDENEIYNAIGEYLARYQRSVLDKNKLARVEQLSLDLKELHPKLKPRPRPFRGLESEREQAELDAKEAADAAEKQKLRTQGQKLCLTLQEQLVEALRSY